MKNIIKTVVALLLCLGCLHFPISLNAKEKSTYVDKIEFSDNFTAEDALLLAEDTAMEKGDIRITKNVIEEGLVYAAYMTQQSKKNNSRDAGDEVWTVTSIEVLRPYGVLKGKYLKKVVAGAAVSSGSPTITLSGNLWGFQIDVVASLTGSVTYSGPSGTDLVSTGVYATHRYFSMIASGKICRYTFTVTDQQTGVYLRTEQKNMTSDRTWTCYSNLGCYNASTGYVIIRSVNSTTTLNIKESNWISYVNSCYVWNYVWF